MKTNKLILAVTTMAILATSVAIVSCKKDDPSNTSQMSYTIQKPADIRQIKDMNAYLQDFKKKLTESKGDEAFSLDDAAWHLACLANIDFCNVNVEYEDFQFDTVEMQVNITDGVILLGDLRSAYEQMCTEIQQFKKGFNHCDQNMYYVNMSIGADGNAKIALMTSFTYASKNLSDHTWYFSDYFTARVTCNQYFSSDSTYVWNTTAARELQRVLNLFEHHEYEIPLPFGYQTCYFPTRNHTFNYPNCPDPYGSDYLYDSRTFAVTVTSGTYILSRQEMCYCLDSYLGLGYDFISDNLYPDEHPMVWKVTPVEINNWPKLDYHKLYVEYGRPVTPNPPGPPID